MRVRVSSKQGQSLKRQRLAVRGRSGAEMLRTSTEIWCNHFQLRPPFEKKAYGHMWCDASQWDVVEED